MDVWGEQACQMAHIVHQNCSESWSFRTFQVFFFLKYHGWVAFLEKDFRHPLPQTWDYFFNSLGFLHERIWSIFFSRHFSISIFHTTLLPTSTLDTLLLGYAKNLAESWCRHIIDAFLWGNSTILLVISTSNAYLMCDLGKCTNWLVSPLTSDELLM